MDSLPFVTEVPATVQNATPDSHAFCVGIYPLLCRVLTLHTGSPEIAQELSSDVVVRVLTRWAQVRASRNPEAYVVRMGINAANSWFRRVAAERRAQDRMRHPGGGHPDEAVAVAVRTALQQLPTRQRAALILRYYADLSVNDTAELMGCSPGTVKAHTAKAISALRRQGLTRD